MKIKYPSKYIVGIIASMILAANLSFSFDIVVEGKSAASIIIPERPTTIKSKGKKGEETILKEEYWKRYFDGARILQEHIKAMTGAKVPVYYDEKNITGNLILLGPSSYMKNLQIPEDIANEYKSDLKEHVSAIRVVGRNLVMKDIRNEVISDGRSEHNFYAHSVPILLEEVFNVRWFATGYVGRELPPHTDNLKVPDTTVIRKKPSVDFYGYLGPTDYSRLNHSAKYKKMKKWGGHSWGYSVPPEIYFNKEEHPESYHPEYYAVDEKGNTNLGRDMDSLCTSNPDVLKIAVNYYRRIFDQGYEAVEIGQPDGYKSRTSCHCKKCMAFSDTSPEGLGKRIWKFHLEIANELLKSHPDKYLLFLLYGPNRIVPDFVPSPLPKNIILQVTTNYDFVHFDIVEKYKPSAVAIYVYEFTAYNIMGMNGPKSSVENIIRLFENCKKYNVRGIYWCGQGWFNFGMEGPQYWLAHRLQWDWDADPGKLMQEYWSRFYKAAAKPMEKIHTSIAEKKKQALEKLSQKYESHHQYAPLVFQTIFEDNFNRKIYGLIEEAEKLAAGNKILLTRINAVKESYDFNIVTRDAFQARQDFEEDKTVEKLEKWQDSIVRRESFIEGWKKRYEVGEFRNSYCPGLPPTAFTHEKIARTLTSCGPFNIGSTSLFNRALRGIKKHKIKRTRIDMVRGKPDDNYWMMGQNPCHPFVMDSDGEKADIFTDVLMAWDMENLYFRFRCDEPSDKLITEGIEERDDNIEKTDSVEIIMNPPKEFGQKYYRFGVNTEGIKRDLRFGFMRTELDPDPWSIDPDWNPEWSAEIKKIAIPGIWFADITIPWKSIGGLPKPHPGNKQLYMKVNFIRNRPGRSEAEPSKTYIWNASFGDVSLFARFGTLDFMDADGKRYIAK